MPVSTRNAEPETGEIPIDFGPLNQRLGYVLRRAQLAVFHDFRQSFAAVDIRPAEYSTLTIIERNPGLSQTRVAEALGIRKTNFVAMIATLERRGFAWRKPALHDRRSHALHLTERGAELMRELHQISAELENRIVACLGAKEHAALFAPLKALATFAHRPSSDANAVDDQD